MDHVRIDEGVKRGAQHPQPPMARQDESAFNTKIPADLDPDEILHQYLSEHATSRIAERYGIKRRSLVRWLRQVRPEEWRQVQIIRALATKEDGEEGIYDADSALALARARELLRSGQWELERLDRMYAPQQNVTVEIIGDLGDKLRRATERLENQPIDVTPIHIPASDGS